MGRRRRSGFDIPFLPRRMGCCGYCGFSILALVLISVVCCFGVLLVMEDSAPEPLIPNFTPQPIMADRFDTGIQQAASFASSTGRFDFRTTEFEASSWLNLNAERFTETAIPVENIQVLFRNGIVQVYGEVDAGGFSDVPILLEVEVFRTENGQISVDVRDTNVGGFGLPGFMVDEVRQQVRDAIDDQLERISGNYFVEGLFIGDGIFTIQGRVQ